MNKLDWYYHRLQAMSPAEIGYRISQKLRKRRYEARYTKPVSALQAGPELPAADRNQLRGRLSAFLRLTELPPLSHSDYTYVFQTAVPLAAGLNWHQGMHGTWPRDTSSFRIPFRSRDDIGDIRFTWELNRQQFLVPLALSYRQTGEEQYLAMLRRHFYHWLDDNPFLHGVNWASAMEIAIRAYQWLLVYCILEDSADASFLQDLLQAMTTSTAYVMDNLSLYSSANNHLILEAAISSIIGYFLAPVHEQNWFAAGRRRLAEQIPLQVWEDGVNKEQAAHYHAFVLDMLLQYNFFLRAIGEDPLHEPLIRRMAIWIGCLRQGGPVTEVGDSDDAKIMKADERPKDYYHYVLQLASLYYGEQFTDCGELYPEVQLFAAPRELRPYEYESFQLFRQGGYGFWHEQGHYVLFDAGPLGFGSLAAHGHADALSLVYHYKQRPILIDPGTYIYNIEADWRNYFRKTSAHNTLTAGRDQSQMNGPFLWSKKAAAAFTGAGTTEQGVYMEGEHNGYAPQLHRRAVLYDRHEDIVLIADTFPAAAALHFTFAPDLTITACGDRSLYVQETGTYLSFARPFTLTEKWVSPHFLEKKRTTGAEVPHEAGLTITIIANRPIIIEGGTFSDQGRTYTYEDIYRKLQKGAML